MAEPTQPASGRMRIPPPTPGQARLIWLAASGMALAILLALLGTLIWGVGRVLNVLSPVLWPLAIGGILAYLLDPVVDSFERRRMRRNRAVLLVFLLVVLGLAGFLASVVPQLVRESAKLVQQVPGYSQELKDRISDWMARRPVILEWGSRFFSNGTNNVPATAPPTSTNVSVPVVPGETNSVAQPSVPPGAESDWTKQATGRVLEWLGGVMPKIGSWVLEQVTRVASFAGTIISLALVPVFTYYFLVEKRAIVESWTKYLPVRESQFKEELVFVLTAINNYLITFFRGQVVVALCIGVLLTIGFLAVGLDYAVLLGVMAGFLSIIPYLGAVLTIIPALVLAAVEFRDWLHPLLVLGVFGLVQMLEGLVISPKVMGDRVGLHPLTIIIALLVGTTLFGGILGGILAIPFTAALRVLMFRYIWRRRQAEAPVP